MSIKGAEREAILKKLRDRLGMKAPKQRVGPAVNPGIKWHGDDGSHAGDVPKKGAERVYYLKILVLISLIYF